MNTERSVSTSPPCWQRLITSTGIQGYTLSCVHYCQLGQVLSFVSTSLYESCLCLVSRCDPSLSPWCWDQGSAGATPSAAGLLLLFDSEYRSVWLTLLSVWAHCHVIRCQSDVYFFSAIGHSYTSCVSLFIHWIGCHFGFCHDNFSYIQTSGCKITTHNPPKEAVSSMLYIFFLKTNKLSTISAALEFNFQCPCHPCQGNLKEDDLKWLCG